MRLKYLIYILLSLLCSHSACAQEVSFKDTLTAYNHQRIKTNLTGMNVLGVWGIANIADGGIGYFTARQDQWKYFHEMNAVWGIVNTGIAVLGINGVRKEVQQHLTPDQACSHYKITKRIYLINTGLDIVYMAAGVALTRYADNTKNNPALFTGFGRSIALQGAFLFVFDNVMYLSHARYNSRWYRIMDELTLGGNSIGIRHKFK